MSNHTMFDSQNNSHTVLPIGNAVPVAPVCEACGHCVNVWTQPALRSGGTARTYGECKSRTCERHDVTLLVVDGRLVNPEAR